MSQNQQLNKNKVVEEITRSISPTHTHMSAFVWSNQTHFKLQSEDVEEASPDMISSGGNEVTSQTVSFVDNAEGEVVMAASPVNPVARVDNTDDLSLGSFLARPTTISTFNWLTSDTTGVLATIRPWHAFLINPRIRKKIDNFAYFRGKLHIKVVINGTPFQYGLMRACYSPLLGTIQDKIRPSPSGPIPLLTPYSQQPGFYITPAANAGGQMELPFFRHTNWLDMTVDAEVNDMGTINFVIYAPLGVAVSGGTTSVTVQVFAWASDVELMGTTQRLTLQGDEYVEGPVSKVATAIGNAASYLTHIPRIGPFARATEIGATAIGTIARMFGFTNVPVIADVHAFQPQNAPMLASAHIGTPVQKLTLDPKQELSIDPGLHGLSSDDELALPYILGKESYFGATSWSTSDPLDTLIFNMRVTPCLCTAPAILNGAAVEVGRRVYHTPTSYVSQMFAAWRGSLIVRIKIVATKFHKGRLKISYDPRGDISVNNPDLNEVYTQIVDIGEEDDIELEIPYHQQYPWLYLDPTISENWAPGNPLNRRSRLDNGLLTVRVLTTLQAPAAGTINVLAFVRGGHDLEFANPRTRIGYEDGHPTPSLFALQAEDVTNIVPVKYVVGVPSHPHSERYGQNFGEAIGSLRTLLHRYMTMDTVQLVGGVADSTNVWRKIFKIMPPTPGYDPNWGTITRAANIVGAGDSNYYFGPMVHMPYVASMYVGYRGGANYNVTPSVDRMNAISDIRVARTTQVFSVANTRWFNLSTSVLDSETNSAKALALNSSEYLSRSLGGLAITATPTNNSLTFQLPDFKIANFSLATPNGYVNGLPTDGTDRLSADLSICTRIGPAGAFSQINVQTQIAAAPDFTCHFWLCCPTLDYSGVAITPV